LLLDQQAEPNTAANNPSSSAIRLNVFLYIRRTRILLDSFPNPNPIGPGLLFFFTFWPAIFCIIMGVTRVRRAQRDSL